MSEEQAPYEAPPKVTNFSAQVFKVQTLIDGGIRLTLDLIAPTDPQTIVDLFDAKQPGVFLEIAAVTVKQTATDTNGKIREKRPAHKSQWKTEKRPGANSNT